MTTNRAIRKATLADEREVLECLQAAFLPYREDYGELAFVDTVLTPETYRVRLCEMQILVVIGESGRVLGTIAYRLADRDGHIRGMAVRPEHQGAGLAERLLKRAEAELRAAGCIAVTLHTTKPLQRAIRFYERNGFRSAADGGSFFGMELLKYREEL